MQSYNSGYRGKETIQDLVYWLNIGTHESFLSKHIVSTRARNQKYVYSRISLYGQIFIANKNAICPTKII